MEEVAHQASIGSVGLLKCNTTPIGFWSTLSAGKESKTPAIHTNWGSSTNRWPEQSHAPITEQKWKKSNPIDYVVHSNIVL